MPLNLDAGARLPTPHTLENPLTTLDLPESTLFRSLRRGTSSRLAPVLPCRVPKASERGTELPVRKTTLSQGCPVNGPRTGGPTPSHTRCARLSGPALCRCGVRGACRALCAHVVLSPPRGGDRLSRAPALPRCPLPPLPRATLGLGIRGGATLSAGEDGEQVKTVGEWTVRVPQEGF